MDNFSKTTLRIPHLPTLFLIIGYPVFWLEMYVIKMGASRCSMLAWGLWVAVVGYVFVRDVSQIKTSFSDFLKWFGQINLFEKLILSAAFFFIVQIVLVAFLAALLPPHLPQEFDVINYHIAIPRQHLILNSFKHIEWSSADLLLMPINFALAPFWLSGEFPNKIPQFFIALGLVMVVKDILIYYSKHTFWPVIIGVFAIFGSHGIGIQMGTGMLDLVMCYLFFAAWDSFLRGNWFISAIELTFYFWAKAFIPVQSIMIVLLLISIYYFLNWIGFKKWHLFNDVDAEKKDFLWLGCRRIMLYFFILSLLVAGPFLFKSLYYSGTPLYPFGTGMVSVSASTDHSYRVASLKEASKGYLHVKDLYGHGRGVGDFIKHLWIIIVPEKSVNNVYDYPLGLPLLLFGGVFIFHFFDMLKHKIFGILAWGVIIFWLSWWFGSQQARFLYVPMVVIFILGALKFQNSSRVLLACLLVSIAFNGISVFRAHKKDWQYLSKPFEALRARDQELVVQSREYLMQNKTQPVELEFSDIAYAQFPVRITMLKDENYPWVINFKKP